MRFGIALPTLLLIPDMIPANRSVSFGLLMMIGCAFCDFPRALLEENVPTMSDTMCPSSVRILTGTVCREEQSLPVCIGWTGGFSCRRFYLERRYVPWGTTSKYFPKGARSIARGNVSTMVRTKIPHALWTSLRSA